MIDFSNILGQETIKKIYEDGLSEPTKEAGEVFKDTVKAFRLFTAPIQLLAAYQGRLSNYLQKVRDAVPKDNQIEAPASIAGPILERLKFIEESNYLKNLYLNLLQKAIDKEHVGEAHPAFVSIIEQLSPDEALMIKTIQENSISYETIGDTIYEIGAVPKDEIVKNNFPLDTLAFSHHFEMYVQHLIHLNLIETPGYYYGEKDESQMGQPQKQIRFLKITQFGTLFYKACMT